MKHNQIHIYIVYDKVREEPVIPVLARTPAEACRSVLPTLYTRYPMKDVELRDCGECHIRSSHSVIPWSVYTMPENQEENLFAMGYTEEQVHQLMNEANNKKAPVSEIVEDKKEVANE